MTLSEREVFEEALALEDSVQRAEYLNAACAAHGYSRSHLENLLAAVNELGDFLEETGHQWITASMDAVPVPPPITERAGKRVGRYKLLENIGEGGCGVVFLAEQEQPVRRMVALKVIKPGMDTRAVVARFEAERQALAMMDHPHIAKVLDGGATEAGRPFFVMELVRGMRITDYCDENNLSTEQRLALFIQVCNAVQHAHQKGIIHRDIKPSNVLVTVQDGVPTPKVIDFGIAKATGERLTDKTLLTELHQVIGTPPYMSPEQVDLGSADIDTRSDIYSLGGLLYELLTGTPPFDAPTLLRAGLDEMRRRIREEDPPKPSTRLSSLSNADLTDVALHRQLEPTKLPGVMRGDLDSIAMKCLEKDRARRYETADSLALDVQRYLAHEAILAGPPSTTYRLRKFVRRNRGPVIAAAGAMALILVGIVALIVGILIIESQRGQTAEALDRETAERQLKEAALTAEIRAKERTAEALRQMTDEVLEGLLGKQEQFDRREKQFLRDVQGFFEEFTREEGTSKPARTLRAEGFVRVGTMRARFGELAEAEADFRHALALTEGLAREFPNDSSHPENMADIFHRLSNVLGSRGRRPEAEAAARQAVAIYHRLSIEFPHDVRHHRSVASARGALALLLRDNGKLNAAEGEMRQSILLHAKLAEKSPAAPIDRRSLSKGYSSLGAILHSRRERSRAVKEYLQAILMQEKLVTDFPGVHDFCDDLATTHNNLGLLLRELGQNVEAQAAFRRVIDLRETLAGEFPVVPRYQILLAGSYINYAQAMQNRDESAAALDCYTHAIEILNRGMIKKGGDATARLFRLSGYSGRAKLLRRLGRHGEAADDFAQAATSDERTDSTYYLLQQIISIARSGNALQAISITNKLSQREQASEVALLEAAREFAEASDRSKNTYDAAALRREATQFARDSVASARKRYAKGSLKLENALFHVADFCYRQQQYAEAELLYRECREITRELVAKNHEAFTHVTASLARLLTDRSWSERGNYQQSDNSQRAHEAVQLLRECLSDRSRMLIRTDWRLPDTRNRLGFALVAVAATDRKLTQDTQLAHLSEAEQLLVESQNALLNNPRVERKYLRDGLVRMVRLYEYWNELAPSPRNAEQAAAWKAKITAFDNSTAKSKPRAPEPITE